jgi:hypothetical protein
MCVTAELLGGRHFFVTATVFAAFRLLVGQFHEVLHYELVFEAANVLFRVPGQMPLRGRVRSMRWDFFDKDGVVEAAPSLSIACLGSHLVV